MITGSTTRRYKF